MYDFPAGYDNFQFLVVVKGRVALLVPFHRRIRQIGKGKVLVNRQKSKIIGITAFFIRLAGAA